jgi:serine phosphatase RsbU (regulator of sigma subunit)
VICKTTEGIHNHLNASAELWGENYKEIRYSANESIDKLKSFFENVTIIRENFDRKSKEHEKEISNQLNSIKNSVDDVNSSKKIIVEDYFKQETESNNLETKEQMQEEYEEKNSNVETKEQMQEVNEEKEIIQKEEVNEEKEDEKKDLVEDNVPRIEE